MVLCIIRRGIPVFRSWKTSERLGFALYRVARLSTRREDLARHCLELVRSVFPLEKSIRLLGVTISNFGAAAEDDSPQLPLI